ncbi:MAG: N-formylglutamate amidohydrolase [Pseudomonadota bacterium]
MDEKLLERLPRFTWADLKKKLDESAPFEALSPMGTMLLRVKEFKPLIGLAVHAGSRIREELQSKMGIEAEERKYDEDTYSDYFIADFPVQLIGLDSRYEYDVDRKREQAIYLKPFQCWGRKVWQTPPTKEEMEISYQKYDEAHELIDFFVNESIMKFGKATVLDVHTYSHKRPLYGARTSTLPVFNVGTTKLDRKSHTKAIDQLLADLKGVQLNGAAVTVAENDVFKGDGAIISALAPKYPAALIVPLDIKKVFMDETSGKVDETIAQQIRASLAPIIGKLASNP